MNNLPEFAFVASTLDRAAHLREQPAKLAQYWSQAQLLIVDSQGDAYVLDDSGTPQFPRAGQIAPLAFEQATFLGLSQDQAWFALPSQALEQQSLTQVNLRDAAACWPALQAGLFAQARALLYWQSRSQFCGGCGAPASLEHAGYLLRCRQCGLDSYPRTDAAIIVAITDGQRLLLGRQARWPAGRWSVIAGFVESGESLEQTVVRESMEEVGLVVSDIRYAASQPWPFPAALMLGFHARAEPDKPTVGEELEAAQWFSQQDIRDALAGVRYRADGSELPTLSPPISISRWLVEDWLRQQDSLADIERALVA